MIFKIIKLFLNLICHISKRKIAIKKVWIGVDFMKRFLEAIAIMLSWALLVTGAYMGLEHCPRTARIYQYGSMTKVVQKEESVESQEVGEKNEENISEVEKPKKPQEENNSQELDRKKNDSENNNPEETNSQKTEAESNNLDDLENSDDGGEQMPADMPEECREEETPESQTSEPETSEPETSEPGTSEPGTSEPETSEPEISEPETPEPEISQQDSKEQETGNETSEEAGEIELPDSISSIQCTWAEKDSLLYQKEISLDNFQASLVYESGKVVVLEEDEYTISNLKNDVLGQHILTVQYEEWECSLEYTINNYVKEIAYSWPTKEECYEGEEIDGKVLEVKEIMADGTECTLSEDEYELTGVDNTKLDEEQTFTIRAGEHEVTGTCLFRSYQHKKVIYYYDEKEDKAKETKEIEKNLVGTNLLDVTDLEEEDGWDTYTVKKNTLKVNGKKTDLPYKVGKRDFDVECVIKYYKTNYIDNLSYTWPTKDLCYKGEKINKSVLQVYADMAQGEKIELEPEQYELKGIVVQQINPPFNYQIILSPKDVTPLS